MVRDIRKKLSKTILLFVITIMIFIPKQEIAASEIMLGDINGDKIVDSRDMLYILRHIATSTNKKHPEWELKEEKLEAADVTKDGKVDAEDMLLVLRYMAANNSETIKNKHPEWIEFKKKETVEKTKEQEKEEKVEDIKEQEKTEKQEEQTPTPEAKTIEVEKVEINKKSIELDISGTKTDTLKATITPNTATDKSITWTSSNNEVATVDKNGTVTAKSNGTVTITAKSANGKSATCKVTVKTSATKISMTKISDTDCKYITELQSKQIGLLSLQIGPAGADIEDIELKNSNPENLAIERVIDNGTYYIKSALNEKKVLDVAGGSTANKAAIQIYDKNNSEAQQFEIINVGNEYYRIKSKKSGKVLDVVNGGLEAGTKVQQYTSNKTDAQQWEFEYLGNGYYHIKSKVNGLYLDVTGAKANNKTQLQVWTENKSKAQIFKLEQIKKKNPVVANGTYYIKSALNEKKVLDVAGGSKENKVAIQIYDRNNSEAQKFEITGIGNNYYVIRSANSGKVLDIPSASIKVNTKIQQYGYNGTNAQIWKIEKDGDYYRFKSKLSGLYLDVTGAKVNNKTQLQIYTGNKNKAQRFKLEKISTTTKYTNIERIIIKGKKKGTSTISVKLANGKIVTKIVKIKEGYWEVKNQKYIYHYLDGTTKEWTVSEYTAWKKLKEQNVKSQDPTAYTRKGNKFTYLGVERLWRVQDQRANNLAKARGRSPYAITVDIDRRHESIFENHNGLWEPIKSAEVLVGGKWKSYPEGCLDTNIYGKNSLTPTGLYYTTGNNNLKGGNPPINMYWVAFGVKYTNNNLDSFGINGHGDNYEDYLHAPDNGGIITEGRAVGQGCVNASPEHAKWIYEHCGRGTPVLIW